MGYGPVPGGGGPSPSNATPTTDSGAGAPGVSLEYARGDHQHPAAGGGGAMVPLWSNTTFVNGASGAGASLLDKGSVVTMAANTIGKGSHMRFKSRCGLNYNNGASQQVAIFITLNGTQHQVFVTNALPAGTQAYGVHIDLDMWWIDASHLYCMASVTLAGEDPIAGFTGTQDNQQRAGSFTADSTASMTIDIGAALNTVDANNSLQVDTAALWGEVYGAGTHL